MPGLQDAVMREPDDPPNGLGRVHVLTFVLLAIVAVMAYCMAGHL